MKALIAARNDLIEWIRTCVLLNLKSNIVAKFVWKNIIYCFKCFKSAVINEKLKNKAITKQLINRYKVKIKISLTCHSMNNKTIERKHQSIVNILSKRI